MKVIVLIPTAEYRHYAGARIRYGRIGRDLAERGVELLLCDIAEFAPESSGGDVLIISKCHDSRALLAAAIMADRGSLVGVDLFDDYFSQLADARLARFRNWLTQLLPNCHFALCSTNVMASVVRQYRSDIPVHVMNDMAADLNLDLLPEILARKSAEARSKRRLAVAWFGVGDNPNFPIGLHDVTSFAGVLSELGRTGMDVQLRILTNARALNAVHLAQIAHLPVRTEVAEWTEDGERKLLADSFVAFLPVNSQPFSAAKSLNRAVTALSSGCQVLSVGYPLYAQLDELIYRDADILLGDLVHNRLKFSPERMDVYNAALESCASGPGEAARLAEFLTGLTPSTRGEGTLVVVHGLSTNGGGHKMVHAANGLSVASPYCTTPLGFDVIFQGRGGSLTMLVSEKVARRLQSNAGCEVGLGATISGKKFVQVSECGLGANGSSNSGIKWEEASLPFQLATYARTMEQIRQRMTAAFGPCRTIVSETSLVPVSPYPQSSIA